MTLKERVENLKVLSIGLVGSAILRIVNATLRWECVGLSDEEEWWADGPPSILAFWHGRQLFIPWIYLNHHKSSHAPALTALISQHSDGRMVAAAMHFIGVDSVAGSSSRGGLRALHLLLRKLKSDSHIAITPDGPKGPPQKLKMGVILLAQRSGAKIQPAAFAAERFFRFKSWDGMIFPRPFSRAVFVKGAPLTLKSDSTPDELPAIAAQVEDALNDVTRRADEYFLTLPSPSLRVCSRLG